MSKTVFNDNFVRHCFNKLSRDWPNSSKAKTLKESSTLYQNTRGIPIPP